MPTMTLESRVEFSNIPGYQKIIDDNTNKISIMKGVINNLEILKVEIDPYVTQNGYNPNDPDPTMKEYIATFGQLTKNMVSGDDIAIVDDLTKEIDGKTTYTKDTLVGTPTTTGCEYELANNVSAADLDKYVRREPYPLSLPAGHTPYNNLNGFLYYSDYYNNHAGFGLCNAIQNSGQYGPASGQEITIGKHTDIGGLGLNGNNNCGVISRRLEKLFGVY
jgi:hypothetical protein